MKNIFVPHIQIVSQWKSCYYDYQTLKQMIKILQESTQLLNELRLQYQILHSENRQQSSSISRLIVHVSEIIVTWHRKFIYYEDLEMTIIYIFVQYKSFELRAKLFKYQTIANTLPRGDKDVLCLLENLYIEIYYLNKMVSYNIKQKNNIQIKLSQFTDDRNITQQNLKYLRMQWVIRNLKKSVEEVYVIKNQKHTDQIFTNLLHSNDSSKSQRNLIYYFGIWFGVIVALLGAIFFFKDLKNIDVATDKEFQAVFPMWRGVSYILVFLWFLGFTVLLCQFLKIDYKLVLQIQSNCIPRSIYILFSASMFTTIFIILFILYLLEKTHYINTNLGYHYAGIVWIIFLGYFFLPLPIFHWKGRAYFFKLIFYVITTPFRRSSFILIWFTQNIVSFNQPFSDFAYTICKYNDQSSQCKSIPLGIAILLMTLFIFRFIQNVKLALQTKAPCFSAPVMGCGRASLSFMNVLSSYVYRVDPRPNTFIFWLCFAISSTIWAWYIDVKFDWGCLFWQKEEMLLRKRLTVPRIFYYFIIVLNFFLRAAWTLTISSQIINNSGVLPYLFIMILSYFQLFRRAIWNFFRIQNQHTKNCEKYQAIIDISPIQTKAYKKYQKLKGRRSFNEMESQLRDQRKKKQFAQMVSLIQNKKQCKRGLKVFITQSKVKIDNYKSTFKIIIQKP